MIKLLILQVQKETKNCISKYLFQAQQKLLCVMQKLGYSMTMRMHWASSLQTQPIFTRTVRGKHKILIKMENSDCKVKILLSYIRTSTIKIPKAVVMKRSTILKIIQKAPLIHNMSIHLCWGKTAMELINSLRSIIWLKICRVWGSRVRGCLK